MFAAQAYATVIDDGDLLQLAVLREHLVQFLLVRAFAQAKDTEYQRRFHQRLQGNTDATVRPTRSLASVTVDATWGHETYVVPAAAGGAALCTAG